MDTVTAYIAFLMEGNRETPLFVCCGDALNARTGAEEASLSADVLPVLMEQGLIPSDAKGNIVFRKTVLLGKIQEHQVSPSEEPARKEPETEKGSPACSPRNAEEGAEKDIFSEFDPFVESMPDRKTASDAGDKKLKADGETDAVPGSSSEGSNPDNTEKNPDKTEKILFEGYFLTEDGKEEYRKALSMEPLSETKDISELESPVAITFYRRHGIRNPRKERYGTKVLLHVNAYAEGTVETHSGNAWCEGFRVDAVSGKELPEPLILSGRYEVHPRHASKLDFENGKPEDFTVEAVFGGRTTEGKILQ